LASETPQQTQEHLTAAALSDQTFEIPQQTPQRLAPAAITLIEVQLSHINITAAITYLLFHMYVSNVMICCSSFSTVVICFLNMTLLRMLNVLQCVVM